MKFVYSSRTGNTEALIKNLGLQAEKITDGSQHIDEPFILFTYTDGYGIVPKIVDNFLQQNKKYIQGVIVTGNKDRHADTFCFAGDMISQDYNVPCLRKVHGQGTPEDWKIILEEINKL